MPPGDIEVALPRARGGRREGGASPGAIPVVLGGDHSIAFPDAKGVANVLGHGRVSMIHFDAHADTGDIEFGSLWGHGQPMRRLIESGALRGDRFLQVGLRGYWPGPETLDWMAEQSMRSYEMTEIGRRGLEECLTEAFAIAIDECEGVFLSVDIDVCDPGHAPGTGTPEPGGLTARQLLDAVRRICLELPVVGVDVVEVSPPYDHADITAALANRVVLEALSAIARKRRDERDGDHLGPVSPAAGGTPAGGRLTAGPVGPRSAPREDARRGPAEGERSAGVDRAAARCRSSSSATRCTGSRCRSRPPAPTPHGPSGRACSTSSTTTCCRACAASTRPCWPWSAGPPGAGKSTLVNSLVRRARSPGPACCGPTTRSPVLVHHPDDAEWFTDQRAADLARLTGDDAEPTARHRPQDHQLRLVPSAPLPPGLALLDAPDIDSVVDANRELATQLLAAGDLWLFVTTAARYADAVPWDLLRTRRRAGHLGRRGARPRPAGRDGRGARRTSRRCCATTASATAPLFTVAESTRVTTTACCPRRRSSRCGRGSPVWPSSARARALVVRRTLAGALDLARQARPGARRRRPTQQAEAAGPAARGGALRVRGGRPAARAGPHRRLAAARRGARPVAGVRRHGRVLPRAGVGRRPAARPHRRRAVTGRPAPAEPLGEALQTGVAALVAGAGRGRRRAGRAQLAVATAAGAALLQAARSDVTRLPADFDERLQRLVRDWQGFVLDLVREQGAVEARPGPGPVVRRQRARCRADGRRVRQHRVHPHRRRGRRGGRHARWWARSCSRRSSATRRCATLAARARDELLDPRRRAARGRARAAARPARRDAGVDPRRGPRCATVGSAGEGRAMSRAQPASGGATPADLDARTGALREALDRGGDRLDPDAVAEARAPSWRVPTSGSRLGVEHTVVALAGATGSGKSSLFNALAGIEVATVGARRPTTSEPTAVVWGEGGDALLEWLDVPRRHRTSRESELDGRDQSDLRGLVLLDLPDHDSTAGVAPARGRPAGRPGRPAGVGRRPAEVRRRRCCTTRYLRRLAGHQAVMVVVLNQVDRLPDDQVHECVDRPAAAAARPTACRRCRCCATSARTGEGVGDLRDAMGEAVRHHEVVAQRVRRRRRDRGRRACAPAWGSPSATPRRCPAASCWSTRWCGRPACPPCSRRSTPTTAAARAPGTGWPFSRWVARFKPDPLRRLRIGPPTSKQTPPDPELSALGRSSLPAPTQAQRAQVELATRQVATRCSEDLPQRWADAVSRRRRAARARPRRRARPGGDVASTCRTGRRSGGGWPGSCRCCWRSPPSSGCSGWSPSAWWAGCGCPRSRRRWWARSRCRRCCWSAGWLAGAAAGRRAPARSRAPAPAGDPPGRQGRCGTPSAGSRPPRCSSRWGGCSPTTAPSRLALGTRAADTSRRPQGRSARRDPQDGAAAGATRRQATAPSGLPARCGPCSHGGARERDPCHRRRQPGRRPRPARHARRARGRRLPPRQHRAPLRRRARPLGRRPHVVLLGELLGLPGAQRRRVAAQGRAGGRHRPARRPRVRRATTRCCAPASTSWPTRWGTTSPTAPAGSPRCGAGSPRPRTGPRGPTEAAPDGPDNVLDEEEPRRSGRRESDPFVEADGMRIGRDGVPEAVPVAGREASARRAAGGCRARPADSERARCRP